MCWQRKLKDQRHPEKGIQTRDCRTAKQHLYKTHKTAELYCGLALSVAAHCFKNRTPAAYIIAFLGQVSAKIRNDLSVESFYIPALIFYNNTINDS